jgi:hypothetical protein
MTPELEPEVLRPGESLPRRARAAGNENITDEQLDTLAGLLDDVFRVPGTNIRFGLDALLGVIPGIGDVITGMASLLMIYSAWERGLPRATIGRMLANIAIDSMVGTIPLAGDVFDVAWKSNRKNYDLLMRDRSNARTQTFKDWLFLMFAALVVIILAVSPFVLLYLVVRQFWG